jgi:hypothetical protein
MGRPRRLSPLFFAQEKDKLEAYRAVKRRLDPTQVVSTEARTRSLGRGLTLSLLLRVWTSRWAERGLMHALLHCTRGSQWSVGFL